MQKKFFHSLWGRRGLGGVAAQIDGGVSPGCRIWAGGAHVTETRGGLRGGGVTRGSGLSRTGGGDESQPRRDVGGAGPGW